MEVFETDFAHSQNDWTIVLSKVSPQYFDKEFYIGNRSGDRNELYLNIVRNNNPVRVIKLSAVSTAYMSFTPEQTLKIWGDDLVLVVNDTLLSLSLYEGEMNWKIQPEHDSFFSFHGLEDDILLRGELRIYRINKYGEILWEYGGADIWVNMDGLPEVIVNENSIGLIDFANNRYEIDFNGKTLKYTAK